MIYNRDDIKTTNYIAQEGDYTVKIIDVLERMVNDIPVHDFKLEDINGAGEIKMSIFLKPTTMWLHAKLRTVCGFNDEHKVVDTYPASKECIGQIINITVEKAKPTYNAVTNVTTESKYFNVAKFGKAD